MSVNGVIGRRLRSLADLRSQFAACCHVTDVVNFDHIFWIIGLYKLLKLNLARMRKASDVCTAVKRDDTQIQLRARRNSVIGRTAKLHCSESAYLGTISTDVGCVVLRRGG